MKQAITFLLLLLSSFCNAQTISANTYAPVIKQQAETMTLLFLKKDYKAYAVFIYPELMALRGGREKTIAALKQGAASITEAGAVIESMTIGEPAEIIVSGETLQCLVPQQMVMKMKQKKIIAHSSLIAISKDQGKKWYFLDATSVPIDVIREILPDLSDQLVIPEVTHEVITEK